MLRPGERFDGFEVRSLIGAGGMGTVVRARQISLDRDVAIKLIKLPEDADRSEQRDFLKRFRREIEIQSHLDHPNLVKVYDSGTWQDNLYLVMELVEGRPLSEALTAGVPIPAPVAVEVAGLLLEGLSCLHERSIVHRDLKPGNVMVTPQGDVKLLDFGLARSAQDTAITRPGSIMGTLAYLAPEQLDGDAKPASDVYATGIILHQMLTGRMPYVGLDVSHWCMLIVSFEPRPVHLENPAVPPEIGHLVTRMLSKSEDARPTAPEAHALLTRTLLGIPDEGPAGGRRTQRLWTPAGEAPAFAAVTEGRVIEREPTTVLTRSRGSMPGWLPGPSVVPGTRRGWGLLALLTSLAVVGIAGVHLAGRSVPAAYRLGLKYREQKTVWWERPACEGEALADLLRTSERLAASEDPQALANLAFGAGHPGAGAGAGAPDPGRALTLWERAARAGSLDAMNKLGWLHLEGDGVPRDGTRARNHLERASDAGSAMACTILGDMYRTGRTLEVDHVRACWWLEEAARRGDALGMRHLAEHHSQGWGVPVDHARALDLLRRAAELGEDAAIREVGMKFYHGLGVGRSLEEAVQWFRRSADAGNPEALMSLGACSMRGEGVPRDPVRAIELYQQSADRGHAFAQTRLGNVYWEGLPGVPPDRGKALFWLRKAAAGGAGQAHLKLARILDAGLEGGPDPAMAVHHLQKAAEIGITEAMVLLAAHHEQGSGVRTSFEEAFHWYERAVAAGDDGARIRLARMLAQGSGTRPDPARARQLYQESAMRGSAEAQYQLGRMLATGAARGPDRDRGLAWLDQAARAGHEPARHLWLELSRAPAPR